MSVLIFEKPAVPRGSLIVISGVTGFIGSHVADQALAAGYRVRGTTRSVQRGAWAERYFRHKYGPDSFGLVEVPDMAAENAFGDAAKGNYETCVLFTSLNSLFLQMLLDSSTSQTT